VVHRGSEEEEEALMDPKVDRGLLSRGLVVEQEWEMSKHLPAKQRRLLLEMVADYVALPMKYRHGLEGGHDGGGSPGGGAMEQLGSPGFTQQRRKVDDVMAQEGAFIRELFRSPEGEERAAVVGGDAPEFSRRLFEEISKEVMVQQPFPLRPGSHLEMTRPKLEFLKQVCFIFGLDAEVKPDVDVMKRGLLKLLGVREFSAAAQYQNPSRTLLLADVFCNSPLCSASRDVDLCRDRDFVEAVIQLPNSDQVDLDAKCHVCSVHYDRDIVELRLVQMTRSLASRYSQQDLRCRKCKRASSMMMAPHCACSGTFELSMGPDKVLEKIEIMEGVANYYGFNWLKEELGHIMPRQAEADAMDVAAE